MNNRLRIYLYQKKQNQAYISRKEEYKKSAKMLLFVFSFIVILLIILKIINHG